MVVENWDQVQYTDPPREHFIKTALAKNKRFKLHVVATRGRNPLTSIARENNIIRVKSYAHAHKIVRAR